LVLASPFLSRLYSPEQFGSVALFVAFAGILGIASTGRFELAIALPASDDDAFNLLAVAICSTLVVAGACALCVLAWREPLPAVPGTAMLTRSLHLLPPMVLLNGVYESLNYWFNRHKQYRRLAFNRVLRATAITGATLTLAVTPSRHEGMVIGLLIGQGLATLELALACYLQQRRLHCPATAVGMRQMAGRYKQFGFYSLPGSLLNLVSSQTPVFLLGMLFGPAVVGYYNLTTRVCAAPSSIIAVAVGDVFRQHAMDEVRSDGNCRHTWQTTFTLLSVIAVPTFTILFFTAPHLFPFVFGDQWRTSGVYARSMAPLFMLAFTASALSRTLHVRQKLKQDLIWQVGLAVTTAGALLLGALTGNSTKAITCYAVAYGGMYVVYLGMSFTYACSSDAPVRVATSGFFVTKTSS